MGNPQTDLIREFDRLIRRDPGKRGLIDSEDRFGPLCTDHLLHAAHALMQQSTHVVITTGFYVPAAEIPAAETDGPPGAVLLAMVLQECGIQTSIVTDALCAPVVEATVNAFAYPAGQLDVVATEDEEWVSRFFSKQEVSHLVAVERVGPSHTPDSWGRQERVAGVEPTGFHEKVPCDHHDRCHNMRGEIIDSHTPPLHALFEQLTDFFPDAQTIGVGDGGNEIGMGAIAWEELARRIASEHAGLIPCRIATDWNIVAGTSNWGAAALAASVAVLKDRTGTLFQWQRAEQQRILEAMVREANAVDGVTKQREPTVDGLPFLTYMQPWEGILSFLAR
ncbi:hypothetical protein Pan153_28880 [Gimesia panareensis]|uniref:D-glutamate cyclase-like C-terminal domain-containing protein n=1 Tax=Gimesia panareensis TaxID=2527978 RepID=A0A518FPF3_9PLAN|nr:glutamate cyclase domain-containing protein [Gimesia panareensis]QDV18231.1 hypothetical protein Pan153_28880 [Gimesia panareensis]